MIPDLPTLWLMDHYELTMSLKEIHFLLMLGRQRLWSGMSLLSCVMTLPSMSGGRRFLRIGPLLSNRPFLLHRVCSLCSTLDYSHSSTALTACSKSGIQSALSATPPHTTIPFLFTAKLPLICHLLPLSVGLFQMPCSFPNLYALHILAGLRTCQKLLTPRPHCANSSLPLSTMMWTLPTPPTASSHLSVANRLL